MRLLRRRLAGVDPPAILGPRIAIWGTFDIADYATLLLPRIYERELAARLPLAETDVYSPLGYNHPLRIDGGRPALPLRAPGRRRKRQLADRHDLVVVSGAVIHTRDEHYGQLYSLPREETDRLRPSEFLLDGLGTKLELRCPVVWSAVTAPFELSGAEAERVRTALEARSHVSVRDERSREILVATGAGREIALVPDPGILAHRLFPADVLRKRLEYLRVLGCYPTKGRPILLEIDADHAERAAETATNVAARFGTEPLVLLDPHSAFPEAEAAHVGDVFRLPRDASLEDITAAIASARAFVGGSNATSVALGFGVPCLTPAGAPVVLEPVPEPSSELQDRVDAELDTIADLAERSWSMRAASERSRADELAQALLRNDERYRALLAAHDARGERLVSERMRFAEIIEGLEASDGAIPADVALRLAELENAVFTAQAAEAEARFELEQLREERGRRG